MSAATSSLPIAVKTVIGSSALLIALVSSFFLSRVLLPRHHGYHPSQQIAVAIGLTIVWLAVIELVRIYTPWSIGLWSLVAALAITSLVNCSLILALPYPSDGPDEQRARSLEAGKTVRVKVAGQWRHATLSRDVCSWLFLGLAIAISLVMVPRLIRVNNQKAGFMEFFVDLNMFPGVPPWQRALSPDDSFSIPVTIISHETQTVQCYVQVLVDGQLYRDVDLASLQPGQEAAAVVPFLMEQSGLHEVELHLHREGMAVPYRSLHVWLYVSS